MKNIPTTSTTVEKLKADAKRIKKAEGITHAAALARAAQAAGYEDWHHVNWSLVASETERFYSSFAAEIEEKDSHRQPVADEAIAQPASPEAPIPQEQVYADYLNAQGTAAVTYRKCQKDVFIDVEIEGVRFKGVVGMGGTTPELWRMSSTTRGNCVGSVPLDKAAIYYTNMYPHSPATWCVCKYSHQEARIDLGGLSWAGRHTLAKEFGLVIYFDPTQLTLQEIMALPKGATAGWGVAGLVLDHSPAIQALRQWASLNGKVLTCGYLR